MTETHEQAVKRGKKSRASGKAFEIKVRADLEKRGWIVFRNSNDVKQIDTKNGQTIQFKQTTGHWNPFTRSIQMTQGGFPDFICMKHFGENKGAVGCPHCEIKDGKYTHMLPYGIINGRFPDGYWENHNGKELYGHQMQIWEVNFVECKSNGYLDFQEREKIRWLFNNIKIPIHIASKGKKRGEIVYNKVFEKEAQ